MTGKNFFFAVCVLIANIFLSSCGDPPVAFEQDKNFFPVPPEFRGFSYTSFTADGYTQGKNSSALGELQTQTGSDYIALCFFEFQSYPNSHDIAPNTTGINPLSGAVWSTSSTEEDIRTAIADARSHGMKILFKPQIDLYSGEWRAAISPDEAWFGSYKNFLLKYAKIAEENSVEMFSIGVEYVVATQPKFSSEWRKIIHELRKNFSGKLVYSANWSGAPTFGVSKAEFRQIEFWDELDYIGVDAYFPIADSPNEFPSERKIFSKMKTPVSEISSVAARFGKKILFTEIGFPSAKNFLHAPWRYSPADNPLPDDEAQAVYYEAMIKIFGSQSWCAGFFWWNWESVASKSERTNFTPRNKKAAGILRRYYQGIEA